MFKFIGCMLSLLLTLVLLCPFTASADNIMSEVKLSMGENWEKSSSIEIKEKRKLYIKVINEETKNDEVAGDEEGSGWLRYTVEGLKPLSPEVPSIEIPEILHSDWVQVGDTVTSALDVSPGKYRISLHSSAGNCKGSGAISTNKFAG